MNSLAEFGAKAYNNKIWIKKVLINMKGPVAYWTIKKHEKISEEWILNSNISTFNH